MGFEFYKDQMGFPIVGSVTGPQVDNTDPENPILPEFQLPDGSNSAGGSWWIDQILSDRLPNYKQVLTALTNNTIEYGNPELLQHRFIVEDENGIRIVTGGNTGILWNSLNLTNVSQLNNDAGYLQSNDLDGFLYNVTYTSNNHVLTFFRQNQPNIVVDLPIEQLITGVQLVGDDLVFTFEDGSTVTVPMNTLLVGVVKSVNGLTPNSQGEIVLQITDIPGLQSALNGKVNLSGNNATGDLLETINWRHEHANKALLDTYNQTNTNITDAVNKRHDAVTLGANTNGLSLVAQVLSLALATSLSAGAMSSADKTKLDNIAPNANNYVLPTMSPTVLGGAKVGSGLSIDANGVLSNTAQNVTQVLGISGNTVSLSGGGGSVTVPYTDWANIPNKPTTFPPSVHTHPTNQITALTGYVLGTNAALSATDSLNVALGKIQAQINAKTSNVGTVTSIQTGAGLTGGPITNAGTIALNAATIASLAKADTALQSGDNVSELVNDANYATVGQLPTVGNGALSIGVPTGLGVTGSFTANQQGNSAFNISYASGYQGYTTAESNKLAGIANNANNYVLPTASATILGGIKVGANLSIDTNGVLSSSYINTTYSAGNGLTLAGTVFSLPVTQTGTGNAVTAVTQTANGITVAKGANFLTSFTETDPTVPAWVKAITTGDITNWNSKQNALSAGNHIDITSNVVSVVLRQNNWVTDDAGNQRIYTGTTTPQNDFIFRLSQAIGMYTFRASTNGTIGTLDTSGWKLNVGNYSIGSQNGTALFRDMGAVSGGWARNTYQVSSNGNVVDTIGHLGSSGALTYGFIGGTAFNSKNAIRWGANGNVGVGYSSTTSNFQYQLEIRTDDYVGIFVRKVGSATGSAIGFGSTANYFGDVGFGVTNNDFTVRNATGDTLFKINQSNNVPSFPNLPGVQTGTTGNLAYINGTGEIWRHQLTIGDLITTSNIGGYIPPAQTLVTNTTSVSGNTGGYIGITGGNDINLASIGRTNLTNFDDISNLGLGLFPIFNTTGSLGYPATVGAGFVSVRNPVNNSGANFAFWVSNSNSENLLYLNTSGANGWNGWQTIATRDWVNNAISSAGGNYMTTNTNQLTLTGTKLSTDWWQFAFRENTWYKDSQGADRLYFGTTANTNGIIFRLSQSTQQFQFRDSANTIVGFISSIGHYRGSAFSIYGGTSSQFLKADGSVDTNVYALASSLTNGTVTSVSSTVAGTALNVAVTNPTTTPALAFTWSGTSSQIVLGNGSLGTLPTQLVYTGSNGINVTGTVISPVYGTTANTIAQGNDSRINNGQTAFSWGNHAGLYVPTSRTITINGVTQNLSANRTWTIPDTDTITRLRGTASGTYVSGDLTLLAGSNVAISQSGTNFTISATNTTYSGSASIIAVGNTFQRAALTGDVIANQNSNVLTLVNTGVTAGTYNSVQVDTKGRVIGASNQPYQTPSQVVNIVNNMMQPVIDGVTRHFTGGNMHVPIVTKKTIVTIATGAINVDLDIDDAPYNGYELAINGCGEWSANLNGSFIDKCNNPAPVGASGSSSLFWWNEDRWEQAI